MRNHQATRNSFAFGLTIGKAKLWVEGAGPRGIYASLLVMILLVIAGWMWWAN